MDWQHRYLPTWFWLLSWLRIYWGTLFYFAWTVVASLIPFWLGVLMFMAYGHCWKWSFFYEKGEFYLYSTAYLTNAIYLLRKQNSQEGGVHFIITLSAALLLVIVAALYASLNTSEIIFGSNGFVQPFLWISSLVIFLISILFSLIALIADFDISKIPASSAIQEEQVDVLDQELNEEERTERGTR